VLPEASGRGYDASVACASYRPRGRSYQAMRLRNLVLNSFLKMDYWNTAIAMQSSTIEAYYARLDLLGIKDICYVFLFGLTAHTRK
jgi:hypothetical protein